MKFDKLKSIAGKAVGSTKDFCSSQKNLPVFKNPFISKPGLKKSLVKGLASVNYDAVISFLEKSKVGNPKFDVAINSMNALKEVTSAYKISTSEDPEQELIDNLATLSKEIRFDEVLSTIEPFADKIPFGSVIIMALRLCTTLKQ